MGRGALNARLFHVHLQIALFDIIRLPAGHGSRGCVLRLRHFSIM